MARMMDSLILDNLAPIAFTKITTRCPAHNVKKASSSQSIPQSQTNVALGGMRNVGPQKAKIPTQGKYLFKCHFLRSDDFFDCAKFLLTHLLNDKMSKKK